MELYGVYLPKLHERSSMRDLYDDAQKSITRDPTEFCHVATMTISVVFLSWLFR